MQVGQQSHLVCYSSTVAFTNFKTVLWTKGKK